MDKFKKKIPASIAIFGASGHIGKPMARWLSYHAPDISLRLITSNPQKVADLQKAFPAAEVMVANYYDQSSLVPAVRGMEGLFVNTPGGTDETAAMGNLVAAIGDGADLVHLVRQLSAYPSPNPRRVPEYAVGSGRGIETQHPIAARILHDSELPVTYLNIGASFMDNFFVMPMLSPGKLTWPSRRVPFIDPRDIGEAAARILIDGNARHIHQFHTLNNGHDSLVMEDIVKMMSDTLLMDIEYDSSLEGLRKVFEPAVQAGKAPPTMPDMLWNFFRYEDENDVAWSMNDCLERILGRQPVTMRSWLREHQDALRQRLQPVSAAF
ncbi:NmrA family NAD(P)-binding protein [Sphingobium sp.]|uniref:NmrA family NAD(P)-binding protein n=1 Tax=Sphingobium sp. TaxID=1912891 RepID=UPI0028BDDDA7|nr:NmrA family NAD(P)-binding protein [Sphingobium sp.]